jgi:UPF0271 protein
MNAEAPLIAKRRLDLNADLGEGCGDDVALLEIITTANVACGAHAGGGEVLNQTVSAATLRGVAIGAHPSYPDKDNFGRLSMLELISPEELESSLVEQILNVAKTVKRFQLSLSHVKAHGALYNDAVTNFAAAEIFLRAVDSAESILNSGDGETVRLPIMVMCNSVLAQRAVAFQRPILYEVFADRAYTADGYLVPRSEPGAVLRDPDLVVKRILDFLEIGQIQSIDGSQIPMCADTICIHGDNPASVHIARHLRSSLVRTGIVLKAHSA